MRWYKGDLHAHSTASDGLEPVDVVLRQARENGLEFFALTDHKTVDHLKLLPQDAGLILIPGFEFGDRLGHANIFGITHLLSQNRSLDAEQTRESLREARRVGARIAINHPFHYENTWRLPLTGVEHDWIEIWNGPWFNGNQGCLDWWQDRLAAGERIPVAGGSDCHANFPFHYYGQPTTWTAAFAPKAAAILEALCAGRTVLSYSPDGPFIDLSCGNAIVGDVVRGNPVPCRLGIRGLVDSDIVRVVSDRGVEKERKAGCGVLSDVLDGKGRRFLRVEVLRHYPELMDYQMAALSNPIYFAEA